MQQSTQNQPMTIAALIAERQAHLNKSDEQITQEIGYANTNIFVMMKRGTMKIPMHKISVLAPALSLDAAVLLRMVMEEYMPETLALVDALLVTPTLSANETELIASFRWLSKGNDVRPVIMDGNSVIALIAA